MKLVSRVLSPLRVLRNSVHQKQYYALPWPESSTLVVIDPIAGDHAAWTELRDSLKLEKVLMCSLDSAPPSTASPESGLSFESLDKLNFCFLDLPFPLRQGAAPPQTKLAALTLCNEHDSVEDKLPVLFAGDMLDYIRLIPENTLHSLSFPHCKSLFSLTELHLDFARAADNLRIFRSFSDMQLVFSSITPERMKLMLEHVLFNDPNNRLACDKMKRKDFNCTVLSEYREINPLFKLLK